jgi:hypothetical protein
MISKKRKKIRSVASVIMMFSQKVNLSREFPISRKENKTIIGRTLLLFIFGLPYAMCKFFAKYPITSKTKIRAREILLKLILLDTKPGSRPSTTKEPAKVTSSNNRRS